MSKNGPNRRDKVVYTLSFCFGKIVLQEVVGVTGFEPVTLRLSSACSNQLSYTPDALALNLRLASQPDRSLELRRFELLTYSLQSYRSTN